jgi:cardiolipin synthase
MILRKPKYAPGYTAHNRVKLIKGGSAYFDLLEELIDKAIHSIHFQIYIYEADETGNRITEALIRAAHRHVEIYLVLDAYGSNALSPLVIEKMETVGIRFRWFEPMVKSKDFYIGRRMHHKIVVIDGIYGLVGGLNISDRYNDLPGQPAWLDWAIYVEGEGAQELGGRCIELWPRNKFAKASAQSFSHWNSVLPDNEECLLRIRINDWVRNKNQISRSYIEMFHRASHEVIILSSYFLPGRVFRKNLTLAAKRGMKIQLILGGHSDIKMAKAAELFLYPWLLRRGIEIYEYQKSILHGKIAVFDSQWVTVGSYNINNISAYASLELNVDVHHKPFGQVVNSTLQEVIEKECVQITTAAYSKTLNWVVMFKRWMAYELVRLIFFLFTFYFKQEGSSPRKTLPI